MMSFGIFKVILKPSAGIVPIAEAKTVCAGSEKFYKMCESNEVNLMFISLFIFSRFQRSNSTNECE